MNLQKSSNYLKTLDFLFFPWQKYLYHVRRIYQHRIVALDPYVASYHISTLHKFLQISWMYQPTLHPTLHSEFYATYQVVHLDACVALVSNLRSKQAPNAKMQRRILVLTLIFRYGIQRGTWLTFDWLRRPWPTVGRSERQPTFFATWNIQIIYVYNYIVYIRFTPFSWYSKKFG